MSGISNLSLSSGPYSNLFEGIVAAARFVLSRDGNSIPTARSAGTAFVEPMPLLVTAFSSRC